MGRGREGSSEEALRFFIKTYKAKQILMGVICSWVLYLSLSGRIKGSAE